MRVGIVGAGITGLAAAWMLEGAGYEVILFEKNSYLGGHAHTLRVQRDKWTVDVDTAFSYLSTQMYPHFIKFLRRLGIIAEPTNTTFMLYSRPRQETLLVMPSLSPGRLRTALRPSMLMRLSQLAHAIKAAAVYEVREDWSVSVEEYLDRLPSIAGFPNKYMLPLLASLMGVDSAGAKEFSIRAAAKFLVCPRVKGSLISTDFLKIPSGVSAYVQALVPKLSAVQVKLGAEIRTIRKESSRFVLTEVNGKTHGCDQIIIAAPAFKALQLLATLPGMEHAQENLRCMKYIETTIGVHSDSSFMPHRRHDWSLANNAIDEATTDAVIHAHWSRIMDETANPRRSAMG